VKCNLLCVQCIVRTRKSDSGNSMKSLQISADTNSSSKTPTVRMPVPHILMFKS
jgi:hypothetical protein